MEWPAWEPWVIMPPVGTWSWLDHPTLTSVQWQRHHRDHVALNDGKTHYLSEMTNHMRSFSPLILNSFILQLQLQTCLYNPRLRLVKSHGLTPETTATIGGIFRGAALSWGMRNRSYQRWEMISHSFPKDQPPLAVGFSMNLLSASPKLTGENLNVMIFFKYMN